MIAEFETPKFCTSIIFPPWCAAGEKMKRKVGCPCRIGPYGIDVPGDP